MNPIVPFPKRGRTLRRSEIRRGAPAQILFFTGVRYERHASDQALAEEILTLIEVAATARRRRTRRKKSA